MAKTPEKQILIEEVKRKIEELLSTDAYSEAEKISIIKEAKALLGESTVSERVS